MIDNSALSGHGSHITNEPWLNDDVRDREVLPVKIDEILHTFQNNGGQSSMGKLGLRAAPRSGDLRSIWVRKGL